MSNIQITWTMDISKNELFFQNVFPLMDIRCHRCHRVIPIRLASREKKCRSMEKVFSEEHKKEIIEVLTWIRCPFCHFNKAWVCDYHELTRDGEKTNSRHDVGSEGDMSDFNPDQRQTGDIELPSRSDL